jgi:hypothetical protein
LLFATPTLVPAPLHDEPGKLLLHMVIQLLPEALFAKYCTTGVGVAMGVFVGTGVLVGYGVLVGGAEVFVGAGVPSIGFTIISKVGHTPAAGVTAAKPFIPPEQTTKLFAVFSIELQVVYFVPEEFDS